MWIICCSSQTKYVVFDIDIFGTQKCHSKTKLDWLGVQSATHTHTHTHTLFLPLMIKITIFGHGMININCWQDQSPTDKLKGM
jgi:hypothetical protein